MNILQNQLGGQNLKNEDLSNNIEKVKAETSRTYVSLNSLMDLANKLNLPGPPTTRYWGTHSAMLTGLNVTGAVGTAGTDQWSIRKGPSKGKHWVWASDDTFQVLESARLQVEDPALMNSWRGPASSQFMALILRCDGIPYHGIGRI